MPPSKKMLLDEPIWLGTSGLASAWQVVSGTAGMAYYSVQNLTAAETVSIEEYVFEPEQARRQITGPLPAELEWQALAAKERKRVKRVGYTDRDVDSYMNARRYGK